MCYNSIQEFFARVPTRLFPMKSAHDTLTPMKHFMSVVILFGIKLLSRIFFRFETRWIQSIDRHPWKNIKLFLYLNHTSLYEPLFVGIIPIRILWDASQRVVLPGADKTMNRPLVGRFFKFLFPQVVTITRKRDFSWNQFLEKIDDNSLIAIAPEGRMKRQTGLDSDGNPMSVKGGVVDILLRLKAGNMVIAYSGGLHHVQHPGQLFPSLFKTVKFNLEQLDIATYKAQFDTQNPQEFRRKVIENLTQRLQKNCP